MLTNWATKTLAIYSTTNRVWNVFSPISKHQRIVHLSAFIAKRQPHPWPPIPLYPFSMFFFPPNSLVLLTLFSNKEFIIMTEAKTTAMWHPTFIYHFYFELIYGSNRSSHWGILHINLFLSFYLTTKPYS